MRRLVQCITCCLIGTVPISVLLQLFLSGKWQYKVLNMRCAEQKLVAFVKVHKAAGTTITSFLQRFGSTRNLTFALPKMDFHHIGFFETFHPKNVMSVPNGSVYEIVCHHVVFSKEAFARYLPPDINIIAAVREPMDMLISAFFGFPIYARHVHKLTQIPLNDSRSLILEYIRNPVTYEPDKFKNVSLIINRMSFDFGLPQEQYRNKSYVTGYIKIIDDSMRFVLVADRFDESLVILKRKLCWSTKDIIYLAKHKNKTKKPNLPPNFHEIIRKLAPSDYQIYEYFSNKMNKIALAEARLQDEVRLFRQTLINVSTFCKDSQRQGHENTLRVNATDFSEGFTVHEQDCQLLTITVGNFVRETREKQSKIRLFNLATQSIVFPNNCLERHVHKMVLITAVLNAL